MNKLTLVAPFLFLALCASPVMAQMVPGTSAIGGGAAPKPRDTAPPDIAPPALPGANVIGAVATGPRVARAHSGDPSVDLFAAINKSDYASAQDAIGRGADLNARDALGETPLDLSIALNQNNITFLILATLQESGGSASGPPVLAGGSPAKPGMKPKAHATQVAQVVQVAQVAQVGAQAAPVGHAKAAPPKAAATKSTAPVYGSDSGQPNVSVGYLGFGQK